VGLNINKIKKYIKCTIIFHIQGAGIVAHEQAKIKRHGHKDGFHGFILL